MERNKFEKFCIWFIKNSFALSSIQFWFYRLLNKKKYKKCLICSKTIGIFNIHELIKPFPYYPLELIKDSNYYGHAFWLRKYAGAKKINFAIEHGLYYDNYVPKASHWRVITRIMTYGIKRFEVLSSQLNKNIEMIGPYIHYAESFYSDLETKLIKQHFGKTLLVFPTHLSDEGGYEYDIDNFIKLIIDFKKQYKFDTVLISCYFRDIIEMQIDKRYSDAGFIIVSSGHYYDPYFLSRQKSIIQISDYTISNSIGTHIGYCIYLNKPHTIIGYQNGNSNFSDMKLISSLFSKYTENINKQQYEICDYYWGFSQIKEPSDLQRIIDTNKKIINK